MSDEKALVPVEQKIVEFYEDQVTAVRLDSGEVFVAVRSICDNLGVAWSSQRRRILRDPVLTEEMRPVTLTVMGTGQQVDTLCLPLKFIPGFLFGMNADRVKPEIRDRLIRYQRECYDVLAEAFLDGRLTTDPDFEALLAQDTPEAQAVHMARAMLRLASIQLVMRGQLDDHEERLEALESQLGDPDRYITPDQAMQLSQAVKTVAMKLSKASGRNEYGGVYGELYRKFGITSYKQLPAAKFDEAMSWLNEWRASIEGDIPF
jgi:hypothetical protein